MNDSKQELKLFRESLVKAIEEMVTEFRNRLHAGEKGILVEKCFDSVNKGMAIRTPIIIDLIRTHNPKQKE